MEIIDIRNLSFTYPSSSVSALDNFSLTVSRGEFIVICGYSGCGKSTLLRLIKPGVAPQGNRQGSIEFKGKDVYSLDGKTAASSIGFVAQNPDDMIVTDKVLHELVFGLENLGIAPDEIRRRAGETAAWFGISDILYKQTDELSGGQKQLVNLASVVIMQPEVLLLDEPTSQLDPVAASAFISTLVKINRELGITVIISEHRLEDLCSVADRCCLMNKGTTEFCGSISQTGLYLKDSSSAMFDAMPCAMRVWGSVENEYAPVYDVNSGREFLLDYMKDRQPIPVSRSVLSESSETLLYGDELYFRYSKDGADILRGTSIELKKGEILSILGSNGCGKTTLLKVLAGRIKPYRGSVTAKSVIAYLPQEVSCVFVGKTLNEEFRLTASTLGYSSEKAEEEISRVVSLCHLAHLLNRHPFDLSGGEQHRAALAKLLLTKPGIILLDEPTKGYDAVFKKEFASILQSLKDDGAGIIIVSHDLEFCAEYSDRAALFFDGAIASVDTVHGFFNSNAFYTTPAKRLSGGIIEDAVTVNEIIRSIGGKTQEYPAIQTEKTPSRIEIKADSKKPKLSLRRKIAAALCGAVGVGVYVFSEKNVSLSDMITKDGISPEGIRTVIIYAVLLLLLFGVAALTSVREKKPAIVNRGRLSSRCIAAIVCNIALIPLTLYIGIRFLSDKSYMLVSSLVLLESVLPFLISFEGKKPSSRELSLIAVLCAVSIAGRAAFFMLPQFKPVLAVTVIAGIALGGETGFLVGAVTMLISGFMFGAGPWVAWQMFAMGIIGFIAGILYRIGIIRKSRLSLSLFGAVSAIVIYGGIMNPASLLMWSNAETITKEAVLSYYLSGFLLDCVHAAASFLFLWFFSLPMLEKLDRIKIKYGLKS